MIYRYGSYSHANNEVEVQIAQRGIRSARGYVQFVRHTHQIAGKLQAADQAALTAAINSLKTAYGSDGQNAGLYLDDGSTATSHVLISANAIGGVRVVAGPDFPEGTGAEYSTFRSYTITLQADFPNAAAELLEWEEVLSFAGTTGGRFVYLDVLDGPPQKQLVSRFTTQRIVQAGVAVGATTWPIPAVPIWPAAEHQEQRNVTRRTPRRIANGLTAYPISWQYVFETHIPLEGNPNQR